MSETDTLTEIANEDRELLEELAADESADEGVRALAEAILKHGG